MTEDSGKPTKEERKELGKGVLTRTRGEEGKQCHLNGSNRQSRKTEETDVNRDFIGLILCNDISILHYRTLLVQGDQ